MNEERAWEIFVSYCVGGPGGKRKYGTADTVRALGWALHRLKDRKDMRLSFLHILEPHFLVRARKTFMPYLTKALDRLTLRTIFVVALVLALCH